MSKRKKIDLSVVVPAYNEVANVERLVRDVYAALDGEKIKYELIVVDDGSSDGTAMKLHRLRSKYRKLVVVSLKRRFGQTAAMSAGFDSSRGEVVVSMDADLQNDPRDIMKLVEGLGPDVDLVSGWRKNRKDDGLRVWSSKLANWLIGMITGVRLHDFGCTLKAYKGELVRDLKLYGEMHRFIPAMAAQRGARIKEMVVRHHPRKKGKSKYGMGRVVRVVLDALMVKFLMDFQTRPLHLFGTIGLSLSLVGGGIFSYLSYGRLVLLRPLSDRPLFLVSVFMVLVGIQFVTIGILAEMMMRLYFESTDEKTYKVREIVDRRS